MQNRQKLYIIYFLTFTVALCSIIYELIFSQLLTILFGGTVVRYSITIGLFLFSLGLGSFFYGFIPYDKKKLFILMEIGITLIGIVGVFLLMKTYVYFMFTAQLSSYLWVVLFLSYVPIILIGLISGMEIPLLAELAEQQSTKKKHQFGEVLGIDYFGSLVGTVIFALFLYPFLGVFASVVVVTFLNLIAATFFVWLYHPKHFRVVLIILGILLAVYVFLLLPFMFSIQDYQVKEFRAGKIFNQYFEDEGVTYLTYNVTDFRSTLYQDILFADVFLNPELYEEPFMNYSCLYLDNNLQFCENFVESYHGGLIDFPMQYLSQEDLSVLIIGGGDWIGIDLLLSYETVKEIDHVDIDKQFAQLMKTHPFAKRYHHDSYLSPKVNSYYEDGFKYVLSTQKTYDFIILDLPGVDHDKLSHLYSLEFYTHLHRILNEDGIIVSWTYGQGEQAEFNDHALTLRQTILDAGFEDYLPYYGYSLNHPYPNFIEYFALYAHKPLQKHTINSPYLGFTKSFYEEELPSWKKIVPTTIKPHSIFKPNYDIVVGESDL